MTHGQDPPPTARQFAAELTGGTGRMGDIFAVAKRCIDTDLDRIEELLESPTHGVRVGAVSIMDFQARRRSTPAARRERCMDPEHLQTAVGGWVREAGKRPHQPEGVMTMITLEATPSEPKTARTRHASRQQPPPKGRPS